MLNGIINIYKEPGFTSSDVVAKMRGICRQKKVGHTGTLDPAATGVLPICLGTGTKLCDMLTDRDKEYVAELLLGVSTDTQDTTGKILEEKPVLADPEEIRRAVMSFLGEYDQIPPMYSALKVNGKKLYELAREGKEIPRQARRITIYELEILEIRVPVVTMRVVCSKGTYIRTLCHDIGEKLGCGGAMQKLERTRVGAFFKENAVTLAQAEKIRDEEGLEKILFPVEKAFEEYGRVCVKPEYDRMLQNGNWILPEWLEEQDLCALAEKTAWNEGNGPKDAQGHPNSEEWVRMCTSEGEFLGLYSYHREKQRYQPIKMFLTGRG